MATSIGKLTLDISDVEKKVTEINRILGNIGANQKVKLNISEEVKKQIDKVYNDLQSGVTKITEAAQKAVQAVEAVGKTKVGDAQAKKSAEETAKVIEKATQAYIKLQEAKTKVINLEQSGKADTEQYARAVIAADQATRAFEKYASSIRDAAKESAAGRNATEALAKSQDHLAESLHTKEIEQATQAYIKWQKAKADVYNLETKGMQDTEQFAKATMMANDAYNAWSRYSKGIRDAAKASNEAKQAMRDLGNMKSWVAEQQEAKDQLEYVKQKYFELTDAIRRYKSESISKNEQGMASEQAKIDAIMQEINAIEQVVSASDLEAGIKQQILNTIQQCTTAEKQHSAEVTRTTVATSELESQMMGIMTRLFSIMAVVRMISSLVQNTVEYVSDYSDKMNEIQIITQKSSADIEKLGKTYVNIAKQMNVSSLSIADAAIYFTRQGLAAEEIEERLKNVTMYAKTANVEFRESSEIITAVVNSMNLVEQEAEDGRNATQRVADVFLAVGDSAATSGEEIGQAMQKAAASAGAFGMSFEWLASYIATVSETTRQEARTIGTAFNTIIARLHQIKQNGYNSEDETKINDVQKALAKINIALMDGNNEWRNMDDIFQEIGEKWGDLDGKTKSYIATTMAGVKQQNVFLALMNDLGKQTEGNSRAFELYNIAMDSAGTASEKYSTYMDSVAASQERLTLAQERFYSLLDSSVIKGWNDMLAGLVNNISEAAEVTGGLNIIIPVAVGLFTAFSLAIQKAGTASAFFASVWEKHPVLIAISAAALVVTGLVTVISTLVSTFETADEKIQSANKTLEESKNKVAGFKNTQQELSDAMDEIRESGGSANNQITEYTNLVTKIKNISPGAQKAIDDLNAGFISQSEAVQKINEELEKQIELERRASALALIQKYNNVNPESYDAENSWARRYIDLNAQEIQYDNFEELLRRKFFDKIGGIGDLPKDVYNAIYDIIDEYNLDQYDDEDWGLIGKLIWEQFNLGDDSDNIIAKMSQTAQSAIDEAVNNLSMYMDQLDAGMLRQKLMNAVFGEDGKLTDEEYANYAQNISKAIQDMLLNGFEASDADKISYIAKSIFGDNVLNQSFTPEYIKSLVTNVPGIADTIADAYEEVLAAGFDAVDIQSVFGETDTWVTDLQFMADRMKDMLRDALAEVYSDDDGNDLISELFGEEWENLDFATLGLLHNLAGLEVGIDEIKQAAEGTEDVEAFVENLKKLGEDYGIQNGAENIDNAAMSIKDYTDAIKDANDDLNNVTNALAKLNEGGELNLSDQLGLAAAHPELITVIGDTVALKEKLQELSDTAENKLRNAVRDMLLGSSEMAEISPFAQLLDDYDDINTLQRYLEVFGENAEGYAEISAWVEEAAERLVNASRNMSEAGETWLETKVKTQKEDAIFDEAQLDNFQWQIDELIQAYESANEELGDNSNEIASKIFEQWNGYSEKLRDAIADAYPDVAEALLNVEQIVNDTTKTAEEKATVLATLLPQLVNSLKQASASNDVDDLKTSMSEISAITKDIENIEKVIDQIKNKETIKGEDLINLVQAHPELMSYINDLTLLQSKLKELRDSQKQDKEEAYREMLWSTKESLEGSPFVDIAQLHGFETLRQYAESLDDSSEEYSEVVAYVEKAILNLLRAEQGFAGAEESWLATQVKMQKATAELKQAQDNMFKDQLAMLKGAANQQGGGSQAYSIWDSYTEDMKSAIAEMYPAVQEAMLKVEEAIKDPTKDIEGAAKNLAEVLAVAFASIPSDQLKNDIEKVEQLKNDIAKLDSVLKTLNDGGTVSFDDLLNLASAHPEIFAVIGDLDALKAKLAELGAGSRASLRDAIKDMLLNSPEYFKTTKYYDAQNNKINNLKQFVDSEEGAEYLEAVTAEVNAAADNLASAAENVEKAADSWLQAQAKLAKQNADVNWAKSNGFIEQITRLQDALSNGGMAAVMRVWEQFPKEMREAMASEYPGILQEMAAIETAFEEVKKKQENLYNGNVDLNNRPTIDSKKVIDAGWNMEGYKPGDKSTLYQTEKWAGNNKGALKWNQDVIVSMTPIMENGEVLSPEAIEEYFNSLIESSLNTDELLANDKAGKNLIINVTPVENGDFEGTQEKIDGITESVHDLQEEMYTAEDSTKDLNKELDKAKKYAGSTYFKGTQDAIKKLREGTISATDAFETFNKEADKVAKAGEEITTVNSKMSKGTEVTTSDVNDLASVLNKSAEEILSNWPEAVKMFDDLREAGEAAYNDLNREAVLRITGMSSADFSELQGGLLAIQSTAAATIAMLQATGQWEVATDNLPQEGKSFLPDGEGGGTWVKFTDNAQVTFLKPKSSNPFAKNGGNDLGGSKGGGGGGGGGGKKKSGMTEVEKALDRMDQYHTTQDWRKSYYQSQQNYYDQTGQVQGSIAYMKRQKQAINSQNKVLESNIAEIEKMMEQKKKELAGLKETDEKYEEVADDLDKLQKAHQNYTKKLVDNRTELEKLNDAIKEQRDRIRDMEINLRNEIYRAIEDRENKRKDKLNAQIEMEDKVLEVIKKRYEKERDMIIDSTNLKIESLEKERDLLSEQLELRKKQADQEEKNKKLMELEIQYQRIIADPTRAKEAQKIREQINDLREEMAWDVAEEEVKAQQDALDQQIDSLEDYIEYVNNYYDEMFEHPKKLISEMKKILKMSDDEIIAWLAQNDEEYLASTTKRQKQLKEQWQDMLDGTRGKIKTYWDEVEEIIKKGDAYIIKFLKKNSDEYAKAGKQQAQKFVDEWKKQLEDLKKAHQQIAADIAKTYDYVPKGSGGSDNKNPGGGGSKKTKQYKFTYAKVEYKPFESEQAAIDKIEKLAKAERDQAGRNYPNGGTMYEYYYNLANEHAKDAKKTVTAYKFGGLNFKTGLAWLDGTPDRPERILSAHQTEMFDSMVAALERMSRIAIPTMPDFGDMNFGNGSNVSVGDIIVNVDNLDTDDDYETLAEKVSRVLMERIGKTAVVGGIRIN